MKIEKGMECHRKGCLPANYVRVVDNGIIDGMRGGKAGITSDAACMGITRIMESTAHFGRV